MVHIGIRLLIAPFLVAGGLWLHEFVQAQPTPLLVIDNAMDRSIPFIPWTIWIYFSFFLFIASTVFRIEDKLFWQFVASASLAAVIAWTIVLLLPITSVRPDPALIDSDLYRRIYTFVHEADPSHITFPSLHVAVTWICNFLLWNRSGRGTRFALGVGISLSTLFTKQHLVLDVIGGILLAWFCVWITGKCALIKTRRAHSKSDCSRRAPPGHSCLLHPSAVLVKIKDDTVLLVGLLNQSLSGCKRKTATYLVAVSL